MGKHHEHESHLRWYDEKFRARDADAHRVDSFNTFSSGSGSTISFDSMIDSNTNPSLKTVKRSDTMHSRYVQMLLKQDDIPKLHNILSAFFVWLMLAGFLVFPGTFKSLDGNDADGNDITAKAAEAILHSVRNIPLLVLGAIACAVAVVGMACLALRHVRNYVWLLNRLFFPGIANGCAGLISTLIGVYSAQGGDWSITAKVTAIIEGSYLGICIGLWVLFNYHFLAKVKERHGEYYESRRLAEEELAEKRGPPLDSSAFV
jgi:hypothetical protein